MAITLLFVTLLLVDTTGCGPVESRAEPGSRSTELLGENGLAFNGLSPAGLASSSFASWFQMNPELADRVMTYVVRWVELWMSQVSSGTLHVFQRSS